MQFTADFETTTIENDCRVWAWATCEIGNVDNFTHGNSLDSFFEFAQNSKNATFYFHNLKFDGEFILVWLFEHGFKHVTERKDEAPCTFTTLISDKGQFYTMKIIFDKKGKKSKYIKIIDSLKILPFKVSQIAKGFNLPISKLEIDYTAHRENNHILSDSEIAYIRNDVEIVARALEVLFNQDLTKITQGSNALHDYKNTVGKKNFERWFPVPDYDKDVRQSYKGGYTFLNPKYKNVDIGTGLVLDVNSLYPSVMRDRMLPYGDPIFYKGEYKADAVYPLYVQMLTCQFELKPGYLPTIQLKNNLAFIPTQYLTSSGADPVTICLTSVDLEIFKEHYNLYNVEYHSGWKFKATTGLFTSYIDKWTAIKTEATLNKNKAMRTLAKLMLNALYGKFALNPNVRSNIPVYDNGAIRYIKGPQETREPIYIPVGTFITAWARYKTITSAQKVYKIFAYADTDSLHLDLKLPPELANMSNDELEMLTTAEIQKYGIDIPSDFEISPVALGAWKIESRFTRARFIRQKTYLEDWNPQHTWNTEDYQKELLNITCAGLPEQCYQYVTWENFHEGATYGGKLQPKHVKGGLILKDTEFTIKPG